MGVVYRERIENPEDVVLIRVPKELQGAPLEVMMSPLPEAPVVEVDLEWDAEYRRTHDVHPSWTPELLKILHDAAGSMPGLERGDQYGDEEIGERDWHLLE